MNFTKLETAEQLQQLKKGDRVLVEWRYGSREYKTGNAVQFYRVHSINTKNEVILKPRSNIWFDIDQYLNKDSVALEVWLVEAAPQIKAGDKVTVRTTGSNGRITDIQYEFDRYQLKGISGWQYGLHNIMLENEQRQEAATN